MDLSVKYRADIPWLKQERISELKYGVRLLTRLLPELLTVCVATFHLNGIIFQ